MTTRTQPKLINEKFVETALGPLFAVAIGQGRETLVLWPSIFTDHHVYNELVRALGHRYRFLLIDGPGHGRSKGTETVFSMAACGEAIAQVMDAFDLEKAAVGGTSWGGLAAAELALRVPERVSGLILMNTPMEIDGAKPNLKSRMIALGARWFLRFKAFRNGVAKSFFAADSLKRNRVYLRAFHAMLREANAKRLSIAIRSVILHGAPLKVRLPHIKVPTLVIAGTDDEMYPLETQAAAALQVPQARFDPVPGRHISAIDATESVADAIQSFLCSEIKQ